MTGTTRWGAVALLLGDFRPAGDINRRGLTILKISLGLGLGVQLVPDVLSNMPNLVRSVFSSPITTGGLTAIIINVALPHEEKFLTIFVLN